MIIVMPDADTGLPGYTNAISGKWNYEDFFFKELMPHVEERFRIKKDKRYRAISGLSMGGGGTFLYALHRPDLFSSAAPLSASLGPQSLEEMNKFSYLGYKNSNFNLKPKQQKEIAKGITKVHNIVTGANTYFAQVIFNKTKKNNHFMGGKIIRNLRN